VTLDTAGVPSFVVHTDAAWDFIEFTPAIARVADATDAIFFGTLGQRSPVSRKTTRAFLDRLPPGSIRLLDLNLRPPHYTREVIEAALESASVVKLNEIELDLIAPMLDLGVSEEARAQRLLDAYGLRLVAVTRGERGSTLFAGGRTVDHGGFGTRVVDTVGAGDAFAAALVAGMLKGLELDVINAHANRVASYICGRRGATPDLPADLADFRL
jgi:fructokinase